MEGVTVRMSRSPASLQNGTFPLTKWLSDFIKWLLDFTKWLLALIKRHGVIAKAALVFL